MDFTDLHYQEEPLVIANVWDVPSALMAQKLGVKAIGTSSSAIATLLGYSDGEEMQFSELEYFIRKIQTHNKLPLSVDLESGYSRDPEIIAANIIKLVNLGVVGINLEDSIVSSERTLIKAENFASTLQDIKKQLLKEQVKVFLNIRTDAFLLNSSEALKETKKRIQLYENVGANGIFVPCIEKSEDIKAVVNSTKLPVNVMCMPNLPDFKTLKELGVKRISMGNFLFNKMYAAYKNSLDHVLLTNSFKTVFSESNRPA